MVPSNGSVFSTAFTVSIEAAVGVTTGISAADRAHGRGRRGERRPR
jgi:3,4-dihydroxy 2-butanone 4-phosphate synthase/GTP cyclohydrolase II